MGGSGYRPNDARLVRLVHGDDSVSALPLGSGRDLYPRCGLIRQKAPDVCGRPGLGAFSLVATFSVFPVLEKL
jgi:hypothetical protein